MLPTSTTSRSAAILGMLMCASVVVGILGVFASSHRGAFTEEGARSLVFEGGEWTLALWTGHPKLSVV